VLPDEVEPRLKPDPGPCVCGCGLVGRPSRATFRDGLGPHNRGCKCPRCRGRNVKRSSGARERRKAKRLGGTRALFSGALTGYDLEVPLRGGGFLYVEETTNQAVCRGVNAWWTSKTIRKKTARLLVLPGLRALMMPEVTVMPTRDFEHLVQLAGEPDPERE
jgi:hypothetical protein